MKKLLTVAICASLLLVGCKDDENDTSGNNPNSSTTNYTNPFLSGSSIQTSFIGRITGTSGQPINGAVVQVGNALAVSNTEGFYKIPSTIVDREYAAIKVSATGHFQQVRSIKPRQGHTQMNDIQLIPRITVPAFSAESGGEVSVSGGGKVTFPANALVRPDGSPYTGQVSVATAYLDPTDMELPNYMPGSLAAVNAQGEGVGMITYGMIGLEMYGTGGQALQLANGQSATIEFPVQAAQMSHAPERIPLWFFDENGGLWYEEGFADKAGDVYVGTVSHFSFWNLDLPVPMVHLSGTLVSSSGTPLSNMLVVLTRPNGSAAYANSNAEGYFSGFIPADENLTLQVYHPSCTFGEALFETELGAFTDDTYIENIVADISSEVPGVSFVGALEDCDAQALPGLTITYSTSGGMSGYLLTDANGEFNFSIFCQTEGSITLMAYDYSIMEQDGPYTMTFNAQSTGDPLDFGSLSFCESVTLDNYFTYQEGEHTANFEFTHFGSFIFSSGCYFLSANPTVFNPDSSVTMIGFESPLVLGSTPACESDNGFIYYDFGDENLHYNATFFNTEITITNLTEVNGEYTLIEGTYISLVDVHRMVTENQILIIDETYMATATGSFRYVP